MSCTQFRYSRLVVVPKIGTTLGIDSIYPMCGDVRLASQPTRCFGGLNLMNIHVQPDISGEMACLELTAFDYSEYVAACTSLSIFWYIWKPEGQCEFRIYRYVPLSQSKKNQKKLAAIYAWA